jgi:hypothetical protein
MQDWFPCGQHLLVIDSLVARRYIHVYDFGDQVPSPLPYFLPPLQVYQSTATRIPVTIAALSDFPQPRSVTVVPGGTQLKAGRHWEATVLHVMSPTPIEISVSLQYSDRAPLKPPSTMVGMNWASDATRITFPGRTTYCKLAVSFNLIELRNFDTDNCGTFESLGRFASFLKECGVWQLHVHIETLGHAARLDPIQLNLSTTSHGLSRDELRKGKIGWAMGRYAEMANSPSFTQLKQLFEPTLRPLCPKDEDLFVEFLCYTQLFDSFSICLRSEIAVITDIAIEGDPFEVSSALPLYALFSNAIRVSDNSQFSARHFPRIFGSQCARYVTSASFTRKDKHLIARSNVNMAEMSIFFDVRKRNEICRSISEVSARGRIDCDPRVVPAFLSQICGIAGQLTAAVIADDVLMNESLAGPMLKKSPLLLASERTDAMPGVQHFYSMQPQYVQLNRDGLLANLQKRMRLNIVLCEIGIEEFFFLAGVLSSLTRRDPAFVDLSIARLAEEQMIAAVKAFLEDLRAAK